MGGNIKITNRRIIHNETVADLMIAQVKNLNSITLKSIDVPLQIDEIPIYLLQLHLQEF